VDVVDELGDGSRKDGAVGCSDGTSVRFWERGYARGTLFLFGLTVDSLVS
jgi:hypothetical protein